MADRGPQESALVAAEENGRTLYLHARAIASVKAEMQRDRAMRRDRRVAGEITEARDGGIAVTVVDRTPSAIYRAVVSPDGTLQAPVEAVAAPGELSAYESAAVRARSMAMAFDAPRCGKDYDAIAFPSSASDGWMAYLLPRPARGSVPIGGSYRLEIEGEGVVASRPYTRSCIALAPSPNSVGMMITHLLDPVPTDVHVFWSLWEGKPFFVGVENGAWRIADGRIAPLKGE
ncbi:hypothetical protein [Luteimonas sp. FCS-9]|uniref:hypothetical protein n=1 Tax=Luteimonas sp. FCS-9 TaxID=1547516 RepID=UPI00063E85D7|nr:hypothetical protein [Luteimonas sp. FCS-9]KLJ01925.1 hypothetical protein WQ56_03380 [Luteimonas sp. FCS-9]